MEIYSQDDDSDLELELEVSPPVNNETALEASACAKVDNTCFNCYVIYIHRYLLSPVFAPYLITYFLLY